MYDETARFELHEGLREALGETRGDTPMSLLPPVGWADVATNRDLDALGERLDGILLAIEALRASTTAQIEALRESTTAQIEALQASTTAQFEIARLANGKALAEFDATVHRDMLRLTLSIIGGFVAFAAVLTANNVL